MGQPSSTHRITKPDRLLGLKLALRENPYVFYAYYRRKEDRELNTAIARRGIDLVIEGFPRSGNTFATYAFLAAQDRTVRLAHHFHSSAQFAWAHKHNIPAMLTLREPIGACSSFVVFGGAYDVSAALRRYNAFHRPLLKLADSLVVAPFEEITSDFGACTYRLNERFGCTFTVFDHDKANADAVLQSIAADKARRAEAIGGLYADPLRASYPTAEKNRLKADIADQFDDAVNAPLKREAMDLYAALRYSGKK